MVFQFRIWIILYFMWIDTFRLVQPSHWDKRVNWAACISEDRIKFHFFQFKSKDLNKTIYEYKVHFHLSIVQTRNKKIDGGEETHSRVNKLWIITPFNICKHGYRSPAISPWHSLFSMLLQNRCWLPSSHLHLSVEGPFMAYGHRHVGQARNAGLSNIPRSSPKSRSLVGKILSSTQFSVPDASGGLSPGC